MGRVSRLLSSSPISYISVACGSLVIYEAICSRRKRKEFEHKLWAASYEGSAAALALPSASPMTKDGLRDPYALIAAAVDVASHGGLPSASGAAAPLAADFPRKHLQYISRDEWREALGSAVAAANAAGISEQDIDPKQLAAAIAAARVLSSSRNSSSTSSEADPLRHSRPCPCPCRVFCCLKRFAAAAVTTSSPGVGKVSPVVAAAYEESPSGGAQDCSCAPVGEGATDATAAPPTPAEAADALSKHENLPDIPDFIGDKRLCMGRVAAVQVVKRPLCIVWQRDVASTIAGERALRDSDLTLPYIQWPGRFLRVTYQYFVDASNKTNLDLTVRTHEGHTKGGGYSRKGHDESEGETGTGKSRDPGKPPLSKRQQRVHEGQEDTRVVLHFMDKNDEERSQGIFRWWEYVGLHRLYGLFGRLTRKLSLFVPGYASTVHQSDSSTREWMPPLSICETTVEMRLPRREYTQTSSRRPTQENALSIVGKYLNSRASEESYVVGTPAQAITGETPVAAAGVLAATAGTTKSAAEFSVAAESAREVAAVAAAPAGSAVAAGGNAVSDGSTGVDAHGGRGTSANSTKSEPWESAHDGGDRCRDLVAVKPLKRLTQAWQDITPQQLVVVVYKARKPLQSTPLVVLLQSDKPTSSAASAAGENSAVAGSSKRKNRVSSLARTGAAVGAEKEGGGTAVPVSGSVHHASVTASGDEKGNGPDKKHLHFPYSGELIELAGPTVQSDERVMLSGGGFLVGMGVLKLCLQKLLTRRLLV